MNLFNKLTSLEQEAAAFGFKWETTDQIKEQITSELNEIEVHIQDKDRTKLQEEMGDLLHAVFSLTVFCGLDPQETLANSIDKFERRFNFVKQLAAEKGLSHLNGKSFEELMSFWNQAKKLDGV